MDLADLAEKIGQVVGTLGYTVFGHGVRHGTSEWTWFKGRRQRTDPVRFVTVSGHWRAPDRYVVELWAAVQQEVDDVPDPLWQRLLVDRFQAKNPRELTTTDLFGRLMESAKRAADLAERITLAGDSAQQEPPPIKAEGDSDDENVSGETITPPRLSDTPSIGPQIPQVVANEPRARPELESGRRRAVPIGLNQLRRNTAILHEGEVYSLLDWQLRKAPRAPATLTLKLRHVKSGKVYEKKMPDTHQITAAPIDTRLAHYLYFEGDSYWFMDMETYEQFVVPADVLGDATKYLVGGEEIDVITYEGAPIAVELPLFVVLTVEHVQPPLKGDTVTGASKKVTTNSGLELMVPVFVNEGDRLRVDTRDGRFVEIIRQG